MARTLDIVGRDNTAKQFFWWSSRGGFYELQVEKRISIFHHFGEFSLAHRLVRAM
jgi:hypothetical protein